MTELSPAQKIFNAAQSNSPYIIPKVNRKIASAVLREIVNQLDMVKPPTSLQRHEEKLCHSMGVTECQRHILVIIVELCDSND